MAASLSKSERLCGKKAIAELMERGKGGSAGCLRYKFLPGTEVSRILVSVPKRFFKRAVKRNLLKRRIRESYRLQKDLLSAPVDIAFLYQAREVLPYDTVFAAMTEALKVIASKTE